MADISQRLGDRYGFELYRYLYGRFKGAGPEQGQRVLEEFSSARRCNTALELWDSLIEMDQKSRELERYGAQFAVSDPQRILALERRLPQVVIQQLAF